MNIKDCQTVDEILLWFSENNRVIEAVNRAFELGKTFKLSGNKPWIVCAALRYRDGLIICSPRHCDLIWNGLVGRVTSLPDYPEQGFVDQYGTFYNRTDAFHIATANNQIKAKTGTSGIPLLFSEDLY